MDKKIISCYLPDVNMNNGEQDYVLRQGILNNDRTKLVSRENEADLILLDFRNFPPYNNYKIVYPEKSIIIDFRDDFDKFFQQPCHSYFKRSFINRKNQIVKSNVNYIPIQYGLKIGYTQEHFINKNVQQDIDVSVLFNEKGQPSSKERIKTLNFLKTHSKLKEFKTQMGNVSKAGEPGRSNCEKKYWDTLSRSKIVVTCNPNGWEGDQRFTEATGSKSLVFQDHMYSNYKNPFMHGKHVFYYNLNNLEKLVDEIVFYLQPENEKIRNDMAENAYNHTMKYHVVNHRIDEIIDQYEKQK